MGSGNLLGSQGDELLQDKLYWTLADSLFFVLGGATYLDGADVGVLRNVLVLIESILGELSLLLFNRLLNKELHHWLQRLDGDISRALGGDVLMEDGEGGRSLVDADEFMGAFQDVLGFLMWRRRLSPSQYGTNTRYHRLVDVVRASASRRGGVSAYRGPR